MNGQQEAGRRIVVTGVGVISPIGLGVEKFTENLLAGNTGITSVEPEPFAGVSVRIAAEASEFTDAAARKVYLKMLRKSVKVMCREIQLGVASANLALEQSLLDMEQIDHSRLGIDFGANLMLSPPEVLKDAAFACADEAQTFQYDQWGTTGMGRMEPLWLLKYLPNMPACHIGIFADARGPNNSITMAEASGNLVIGEAYRVIERNHADVMIAGSTGSFIHAVQSVHARMWLNLADEFSACRPFDRERGGQVVGEGACSLILEEESHARERGASIYGEILGTGSSCVSSRQGKPNIRLAAANAMQMALRDANLAPEAIGHVNAHGLSDPQMDAEEAMAIHDVFGDYATEVPVTSLKGYLGNTDSGCGTLELAGSLMALKQGVVPPTLNFENADPECPLNVVHGEPLPITNKVVLNLNFTAFGQASAVVACGA